MTCIYPSSHIFEFWVSLYFVINSILVIFTQGVDVGPHNPVGAKEEYFKVKSRKNANVDRRKKYETFITNYNFVLFIIWFLKNHDCWILLFYYYSCLYKIFVLFRFIGKSQGFRKDFVQVVTRKPDMDVYICINFAMIWWFWFDFNAFGFAFIVLNTFSAIAGCLFGFAVIVLNKYYEKVFDNLVVLLFVFIVCLLSNSNSKIIEFSMWNWTSGCWHKIDYIWYSL